MCSPRLPPRLLMPEKHAPVTYRDAGVDRDAANVAKQRIKELVRSTFTEAVVTDFGTFGGVYRLLAADMMSPGTTETESGGHTLVASADGVGTKLKVAVMTGVHDTVGYDLVAHCANDILTQGALPLFFLDYIALGRMQPGTVEKIIEGLVRACIDVGAVLLGGETAEMPDMYAEGEYDLAGFIVGRAVHERPLDGSSIRPGDVLLGLESDGLHTNGYSLARKLLFEQEHLHVEDRPEGWSRTVGEELLRPHRSYVGPLRALLERGEIKGLAHVTGGGITENVPRMLPGGCGACIDRTAWEVPTVFHTLQQLGAIPEPDMWRTFNMGMGMVAAVRPSLAATVIDHLIGQGEQAHVVGEVIEGSTVRLR